MSGKTVFVTGATGYLGGALVPAMESPPDGVRLVDVPAIRVA